MGACNTGILVRMKAEVIVKREVFAFCTQCKRLNADFSFSFYFSNNLTKELSALFYDKNLLTSSMEGSSNFEFENYEYAV
jgi:hypothetical protein